VTYLDPLVPRDQIFEEDPNAAPLNYVRKEKPIEILSKLNDEDSGNENSQDATPIKKSDKAAVNVSWELIDNPFLRSVKSFRKPAKKSN